MMTELTSHEESNVRPRDDRGRGLLILRRRKWVLLAPLVLVPLVALLVSMSQQKEYTATATLLFQGDSENAEEAERQVATSSELVHLPAVAKRAVKNLGKEATAAEILEHINVESGATDVGKISATTNSPELSARMANAYAHAYIAFRRDTDQLEVQQAIDLVEESLAALPPAELAGERGIGLEGHLNDLKIQQALQTGNATLVQPATPPSSPSSPKTHRNVLLGIIFGAILGIGLAVLLERLDRRARTVEELEQLFELPLLARIPRSRRIRHAGIVDVLQTPESESFRTLRTNLRYFDVDQPLRSILVTSPSADDGKSTVARLLAATMAEIGDDVILVEADLRKGSSYLDAAGQPVVGLSNMLVSQFNFDPVIQITVQSPGSVQGRVLNVLPSGPVPPNPTELLESDRMHALISELNHRYHFVVIDTPALGIVSDALALAPAVSGVLVVGGLGKTTRDAARGFTKQLSRIDVRQLGLVANFAPLQRNQYSNYPLVGASPSSLNS